VGILTHLLFWPVTGPTFLARYSMEKVQEVVRDELTDDARVKEELLALQMALELGDVDDDEYVRREAALMHQLREVREWRERFGMGTAGGPVQVARDAVSEPPASVETPDATERAAGDAGSTETGSGDAGRGGVARSDGAEVDLRLGWD
jgi:hypothetical protein